MPQEVHWQSNLYSGIGHDERYRWHEDYCGEAPTAWIIALHYSFKADTLEPLPLICVRHRLSDLSYHGEHRESLFFISLRGVAVFGVRDPESNAGSIDNQRFNPDVCAPYPTSELLTTASQFATSLSMKAGSIAAIMGRC